MARLLGKYPVEQPDADAGLAGHVAQGRLLPAARSDQADRCLVQEAPGPIPWVVWPRGRPRVRWERCVTRHGLLLDNLHEHVY